MANPAKIVVQLKSNWKLILAVIIIAFLLFSGNKGYKLYSNLIRQNQSTKDSLIEISQLKQDSLLQVIDNGILLSETLAQKINELSNSNRYLYQKIKQREKDLHIMDTSFMVNAKRITKRSNRHRKENDTTQ